MVRVITIGNEGGSFPVYTRLVLIFSVLRRWVVPRTAMFSVLRGWVVPQTAVFSVLHGWVVPQTAMFFVGGLYQTAAMAAMTTIGNIEPFSPESESITVHLERVQLYFRVDVISKDRQVPVLLSLIGTKTYTLLRNFVAPERPGDKSFQGLVKCSTDHFDPKPPVIAERFHFHQRIQSGMESVTECIAELKRITANCNFGDKLEEALPDRLVCGLKNSHIQRKLLTEPGLTYAHAVEIALGREAAEKNS